MSLIAVVNQRVLDVKWVVICNSSIRLMPSTRPFPARAVHPQLALGLMYFVVVFASMQVHKIPTQLNS